MGGPATTNPWLIAIINMTIVFGVLGALGIVINVISMIDPTQKKKTAKPETVAAPVAAPVEVEAQDDTEVIAVIAAAVAAYGYSASQIACIRRVPSQGWAQNARVDAVTTRNQMF